MSNTPHSPRVRIAPSPTGLFHIGTARSALYNWLFARQQGGTFIVRIEDTDKERSRPEYEKNILDGLAWLGLSPDEFARQSERVDIHTRYLTQLLADKKVFYCQHTTKELEDESQRQREAKEPPRHICAHREMSYTEGIIRIKNDATENIIIEDIVRGTVIFDPQTLGDFSLAKTITEPLYNFVATIDDHEMNISHVIRGEDHIPNTPKQILIYQMLDWTPPRWGHLPLLLGTDRSKLSKRHGAVSLQDYRDKGYLPEAMINFMALLGWHPTAHAVGEREKELFTIDELTKAFSLDHVQKGGAVVMLEKLDWFNKEYIKNLSSEELFVRTQPFLETNTFSLDTNKMTRALDLLRTRAVVLKDFHTILTEIFHPPVYEKDILLWRGKIEETTCAQIFDDIIKIFSNIEPAHFEQKTLEESLATLIEKHGKGSVLWPLRAALSGQERSPGPMELAEILGSTETIKRLQQARVLLGTPL